MKRKKKKRGHAWNKLAAKERKELLRAWLQSLPAVLAIILVAVLTPWLRRAARYDITHRYQTAAERAVQDEDLELADLCYRKVAYVDHDDSGRYGLALVAAQRGQSQRALQLMEQIAPLDRARYAPAHYWIAQYLGELPRPASREERLRLLSAIEQHLLHTLQKEPRHDQARISLGLLYWRLGEPRHALKHLRQAETERADILFKIAEAEAVLGDSASAQHYAKLASRQLRDQIQRGEDVVTAEILLAGAQAFLRQHEQAAELLRNGWERTSDPRYKEALVKLYLGWFRLIPKTDKPRRIAVLQQALAFGPEDPAVLASIAGLAAGDDEDQEDVRRLLDGILQDGSSPAAAAAHFVLGTAALAKDDMAEARRHLEQAHQAMPDQAAVANNLAWVLTQIDPPELQRALKLADAALVVAPDRPEIRETRGQILFRLERWKEAARDLEFALEILANDPQLHLTLAEIYENLGDLTLADRHRQAARAATANNR